MNKYKISYEIEYIAKNKKEAMDQFMIDKADTDILDIEMFKIELILLRGGVKKTWVK